MKIIIKTEQRIMRVCSYIVPKKFLKKMVVDTDNNAVSRILTTKEIRCINENMLDSVDESKAIVFEESCNDFSVFNMCYLADLLGKSLFAVAVGGVPEFKLLDREGEDYYKTFFDEPSYLQNTTQECYLRLPNCLKNTPYPHWFMSAKERETYHLLWKKFFHIKNDIMNKFENKYFQIRSCVPNGGKLIGCVARGTDYILKKPSGHPVQPKTDELIAIIKKNIGEKDIVFLATEEKSILDIFYKHIGKGRVITTEQAYFDGLYNSDNINIAEYTFDRENDKYMRGYEYFCRVYILSKCDGLISPMSGATRMALIMKEEKYLPEIVLNYGLY